MTLPFRRRHNDAEASHDRARALIATGFTQAVEPADAAWLDTHLAGCPECVADAAAYAADRELLRALRDQAPEPPRDLWARTAAAIEQEHSRRDRGTRALRTPRGWRVGRVPMGVASGLVVIIVVLSVSLAPRGLPLNPTGPAGGNVGEATPGSEATPIAVTADALAWIQVAPDGSYEFRRATVDTVCPDIRSGCATLAARVMTRLDLTQAPQAVVLSPTGSEIAVVTSSGSIGGAEIVVVPVPTAPTGASASPSPVPPTPDDSATVSPAVTPPSITASPSTTPPGSIGPETISPTPTIEPTGSAAPSAGRSIVSGVIVVGDTAYSPDGQWLAFSARPADGSTGPDLYLWRVGDEQATAVTADHRTFLAGWLGNQVLANTVVSSDLVVAPVLEPAGSPKPEGSPQPEGSPRPAGSPKPSAAADPGVTPDPSAPVVEEHPIAFTLDPETGITTVIAANDMWHPTVDPTGRSVVYWEGTVVSDGTGTGWALGTGRLVIDGWLDGTAEPSADATRSPNSTASGNLPGPTASGDLPVATASGDLRASPRVGPAGHPVTIAEGPGVAFDSLFDPSGLRLAVWLADPTDPAVGTLRLIVLDPDTLQIDSTIDPLPGVAALRGISIEDGRLAWVTPPGQDGEGSHVQVLGWRGREFGQIRTIQAERLFVVR
ncbi:MAG: hypothetical protein V4515_13150 [Chloroflexota bacterium]